MKFCILACQALHSLSSDASLMPLRYNFFEIPTYFPSPVMLFVMKGSGNFVCMLYVFYVLKKEYLFLEKNGQPTSSDTW